MADATAPEASQNIMIPPSGGSEETIVPGGTAMSMLRQVPEVNGTVGSSSIVRATPTAVFASRTPQLIQVRACGEVPDRSISICSPRLRTRTRTV